MLYISDHPDFAALKHTKIRCDLTLVYPIGGGGQFIMGQLTGSYDHNPQSNEYLADGKLWLGWDRLLSGFDQYGHAVVDDEDLLTNAADWALHYLGSRKNYRYSSSHWLPWLTCNLYDFHTIDLVRVTYQAHDEWLLAALSYYKTQCSMMTESYVISRLINHAHDRLPRSFSENEYDICMLKLKQQDQNLDIKNSLASWTYFIDCLHYQRDPSDIAHLRAYLEGHMRLQLDVVSTPLMQPHMDRMIADVKSHCDVWTDLDYCEMFFDLKIPNGSSLKRISTSELARYSRRNLEIAKMVSDWMMPETRTAWQRQIYRYTARLDSACRRL